MNDEFDEIDRLILDGGLEFAGKDSETGEALYKPTDRLKDIDAKLSEDLSVYFSEVTLRLWEKGFLDMDITQKDPLVRLAPKSFDISSIKSLEKNERVVVEEIIKALSAKN
jgi:hypothetical protein